MTRRLPWERDDAPAKAPAKKKTPTSSTPSRKVPTPQRVSPKPEATPTTRERSNRQSASLNGIRADRSPSTSPPPEPLPETFMIEGLEHDDRYRMVEDELFTVAGRFTAHLHAAEYHRLKAQTRSQNAETIMNISRPVVGSLTELARKRQEELLLKRRQREALRQAKRAVGHDRNRDNRNADEGESGDDTGVPPWRGTSLQGLMHSPRKKEVPLMALTRAESAVAGRSSLFGGALGKRPAVLGQGIQEEVDVETEDESDDDDDLGAPVRARAETEVSRVPDVAARPMRLQKPAYEAPKRPATGLHQRAVPSAVGSRSAAPSGARLSATAASEILSVNKSTKTPANAIANHDDDNNEDDDDDDLFTRFRNRNMNARQRRPVTEKKGDKKEPSESRDIIPSFI